MRGLYSVFCRATSYSAGRSRISTHSSDLGCGRNSLLSDG